MKIGILTLWQSNDNYGQQLQCWALQQVLLLLGHDPYLIKYDIDHRVLNKPAWWKKVLKMVLIYPAVKSFRRKLRVKKDADEINEITKKNKIRAFEAFRKDNIRMSDYVYKSLQDLKNNPPLADAYIVGSDQVWAHLLDYSENRAMYLDFGDKDTKRIAYAPSFSMPVYPDKYKQQLKENLARFNSLSVREQTGVGICQELGYMPQVVVDPTMLLRKENYQEIEQPVDEKSYIYLYYLNISETEEVEWKQLHRYAHEGDMKIIATPASGYITGKELFEDVEYVYATIPQWISLIDNAKIVVTTSFHGVVFCILHHTPFVYFPLNGKYSRGNNRVVDLCNMLNLKDRIWSETSSFEKMSNQPVDWDIVDAIMDSKRTESIEYLNNSLS